MVVSPPSLGCFALGGKQLEYPVSITHSLSRHCGLHAWSNAVHSGESQKVHRPVEKHNCAQLVVCWSTFHKHLRVADSLAWGSGQFLPYEYFHHCLYQATKLKSSSFKHSQEVPMSSFEPVQVSSRCHCRKTSVWGEKPPQKGSKNVRGKGELGDEVMKAI